jgi:hypothetical protein
LRHSDGMTGGGLGLFPLVQIFLSSAHPS